MELNAKSNADNTVSVAGEQEPRQMTSMSIDELDMIYGGAYAHKLARARAAYQSPTTSSL